MKIIVARSLCKFEKAAPMSASRSWWQVVLIHKNWQINGLKLVGMHDATNINFI